ncbi:MAG: T9SS type A sorting domain-containing protein [Flavobacteriales bacterium]|nr:T9SS type A sorting domain-containing protein [Flavobacteriales bacterium]
MTMKNALLLGSLLALPLLSHAQTPNTHRDESFVLDLSGAGALSFSPNEFPLTRVLPLSDGRILFFGSLHDPLHTTMSGVVRLNANGSWDNTFDGPDFDQDYYLRIRSAVELSDGKYLVGGQFTDFSNGVNQRGIIRLNNDGSQDMSFNAGFENNPTINAIALQPDGKILIAGAYGTGTHGTGISRLLPDGAVDGTFNAGQAPTNIRDIKVLPNGKILVAGRFNNWPGGLAVLNSDGSRDESFVHTGYIHSSNIFDDVHPRTAIQPDGKIVVAGLQTSSIVKIMRYNADLTPDVSFHAATNSQISGVYPTGVAIQSDGKIIVTGYFLNAYDGVTSISGVMRLNADGTLDSTFDTANGFGNAPLAYHCALQADGRILVVTQNASYQGQGLTLGDGFPTNQYIIRLNGDATGASVGEQEAPFIFGVFPNPASEVASLRDVPVGAVVRMLDVTGRVMLEQRAAQDRMEIPLTSLAPGAYLVNVLHGGHAVTHRLVVER